MITTILAGVAIGFTHLVIGTVIGKWNWKVWKNGKRNFWSFLLFPVATSFGDVGTAQLIPGITNDYSEEDYTKVMAFMWSIKLAFNFALAIPVMGALCAICFTGFFLANIAGRIANVAAQPVTMIEKTAEKYRTWKLAYKPSDPMLDGYTRDDIETQMEEQRRIIETGTKKIQTATVEYERLKKIHASTWSRR